MAVTNIECQIARGQIGRYLSGDGFSDEAVRQLEAHISGCAGCKAHLSDRKAALQAMLGGPPVKAVVEVAEAPTPTAAMNAPKPAPKASPKPEAKKVPIVSASFTRPLMYSLGLGAVLVAMSAFSRGGLDLLGPKAAAATTIAPLPAAPPSPVEKIATPDPILAKTPSTDTLANDSAPPAETSENVAATATATPLSTVSPTAPEPKTKIADPDPKTEATPGADLGTPVTSTSLTPPPTTTAKTAVQPPSDSPKGSTKVAKPAPAAAVTTPKAPVSVAKPARTTAVVHRSPAKRTRRSSVRTRRTRRPTTRRTTTTTRPGIRVYDAAGAPIK